MPRRNNRDKRFDPKDEEDLKLNSGQHRYAGSSKPKRKRKDKGDKQIYRDSQ